MWSITPPLIGLFKLLAQHLSNGGWQWCRGKKGSAAPPLRAARCAVWRWGSDPLSHHKKMASNKRSRWPRLTLCLAYLHSFTLYFVPWRHVLWRGAGRGRLFLIWKMSPYFVARLGGATQTWNARGSKISTAVNAHVKTWRGKEIPWMGKVYYPPALFLCMIWAPSAHFFKDLAVSQ